MMNMNPTSTTRSLLATSPAQSESNTKQGMFDMVTRSCFTALAVLVIIVGSIGNAMVIYVFGWLGRRNRTTVEFIFLLLAVTDLICCVIATPIVAYYFAILGHENSAVGQLVINNVMPNFWPVAFFVSQCLLVLICIDRHRAVVYPFSQRIQPKRVLLIYTMSILIGTGIYLPFSILQLGSMEAQAANGNASMRGGMEREHLVENKTNEFTRAVVDLTRDLLSLSIMTVLILKMLKALKRNQESLRNVGHTSDNERQNKAVRKALILVVTLFLICVLPKDLILFCYTLSVLIEGHPPYNKERYMARLVFYLTIIQLFNCCANIFVYSFVHPTFVAYRLRCMGKITCNGRCCLKSSIEASNVESRTA